MSKILEKAFDATKKIIRSVFLGSPNLITSSDLNRQIEALKYQMDLLDDKTGMVITGAKLTHSLSGGTLTVDFSYSQIKFKGCQFSPSVSKKTINMTASSPKVYLCLTAEKKTVTYSDDLTHEIAGAKFEDSTSYPAANQLVYDSEDVVVTHALSSVENLVGVIASFSLSDNGNIVVRENFTANEQEDTLAMGKAAVVVDFNRNASGTVTNGDTYDAAFSKLQNQVNKGVRVYKLGTNTATTDTHIRKTSSFDLGIVASPKDVMQVFVSFKLKNIKQSISKVMEITTVAAGTQLYYGYECTLGSTEPEQPTVYPLNVQIYLDERARVNVSLNSSEGYTLVPDGEAYFIIYRKDIDSDLEI